MDAVDAGGALRGGDVVVVTREEALRVAALVGTDPGFARRLERLGDVDLGVAVAADVGAGERWPLRQRDAPLDVVAQLADVARPGVLREVREELLCAHDLALGVVGEAQPFDDVVDEQAQVVEALAQRREAHLEHGEAVVEVRAEFLGVDLAAQVPVRGRDDPHVDRRVARRAHALALAALEHAQARTLQLERQLADLVEEDRPAVRRLERALARGDGAGECAALVPEELALQEIAGDGAAVDDDERTLGAPALAVDGLGGDLLARPGLALEEDGRIGRGGALEEGERAAHGDRAADHDAETRALRDGDLHLLGAEVEAHLGPPHRDRRAAVKMSRDDGDAVDARAVEASQVAEERAAVDRRDLAMEARDGRIVQHQVGGVVGADHRPLAVRRVRRAGVGPGDDEQPESLHQRVLLVLGANAEGLDAGLLGHRCRHYILGMSQSLDDVLTPTRSDEGATYLLDVATGWEQGRGAYGGLVIGAMARACEAEAEGRPFRSISAVVMAPVVAGPAHVAVTPLRRGSGVSILRASVSQGGALAAEATALFGAPRPDAPTFVRREAPVLPPWR